LVKIENKLTTKNIVNKKIYVIIFLNNLLMHTFLYHHYNIKCILYHCHWAILSSIFLWLICANQSSNYIHIHMNDFTCFKFHTRSFRTYICIYVMYIPVPYIPILLFTFYWILNLMQTTYKRDANNLLDANNAQMW
jgi:hypothetical protein